GSTPLTNNSGAPPRTLRPITAPGAPSDAISASSDRCSVVRSSVTRFTLVGVGFAALVPPQPTSATVARTHPAETQRDPAPSLMAAVWPPTSHQVDMRVVQRAVIPNDAPPGSRRRAPVALTSASRATATPSAGTSAPIALRGATTVVVRTRPRGWRGHE